ncbi:alcohol dehydrogenase superfamily protein [Mycena albidolilacea]|uniref:Alcohol dehydrogenase superfamily protein n=1 Tax=Mycena albidolilacea TaxID=1033008 RepID=A0AAD6Z656_9AGAR|nr:alcohol dehydrogenase superfamily protein [Mycena albidolilacea]
MVLPSTTRQYSYPKFGSYNELVLHEVPMALPKGNEVLVKTHAVSLQYRDLMIADKLYPGHLQENLVPCSDMAGEVIAVGADVKEWHVGDRVAANFFADKLHDEYTREIRESAFGGALQGVLTEYRTFPAHSLVRIPAHLSYEEASTLPCAAVTAYNAFLSGFEPIKAGDTILVQGTGGVSIFALQFAVVAGATVIATSSNDEKLKVATRLGAKHVINYKTTPAWDKEVLRLTNGRGVDRVIEVAGNVTLKRSIASTRYGGSIDIIGAVADVTASPPNTIFDILFKGLNIRGIHVGSVQQSKDMNRMIEANAEATRPVIDRVFPFEEAKAAFPHMKGQTHIGKVVIKL